MNENKIVKETSCHVNICINVVKAKEVRKIKSEKGRIMSV